MNLLAKSSLVLVCLVASVSTTFAQSAGKRSPVDEPSFHPLLERFDLWKERSDQPAEVEAFIEKVSRRFALKRDLRGPSKHDVAAKMHDGPASFDDMIPLPNRPEGVDFGMPALMNTSNGDLVMAFKEQGVAGTDFFGEPLAPPKLRFMRSTDGGATWMPSVIVRDEADFIFDYNFPQMVEAADGRLLIWDSNPVEPSIMSYSDDGGATWTAGLRVENFVDRFSGPFSGLIWNTYLEQTNGNLVYRTSVDGETWSGETMLRTRPDGGEFYAIRIASAGGSTLAMLLETYTFEPCCELGLALMTSTDNGATWGPLTSLDIAEESLSLFGASLRGAPDGTLHFVAAGEIINENSFLPADIYYATSSDAGVTWTDFEVFTAFAGPDYLPDVGFVDDGALIAFVSDRFLSERGQGNIWYGIAGATPDVNPPPYVNYDFSTIYPGWGQVDVAYPISFSAADESGIQSMNLVFGAEGDATTSIPMRDDGVDPDAAAGDGTYSAILPGGGFGPPTVYFGVASDDSGQEAAGPILTLDRIPVASLGEAIVAVDPAGGIGDLFNYAFPTFGSGQWPGRDGFNYVFGAGLWVGIPAVGGAPSKVMHAFYDSGDPDWVAKEGTYPVSSSSFSDGDFEFTFTDAGAPQPIGLEVNASLHQWASGAAANGVILRYEIVNTSGVDLTGVVSSMWMDGDIYMETSSIFDDKVGYDSGSGVLYMYDSGSDCANEPAIDCVDTHVGLAIVEDPASGKRSAILPQTAARWLDADDPQRNGFSDLGFYNLMTKGIDPGLAGGFVPPSDDHRIIISPQSTAIPAGASSVVAFALVFGHSPDEIVANAQALVAAYGAGPVAADEDTPGEQPARFELGQNYPNPFNPSTVIPFSVGEAGRVTVSVTDVLGRRVAVLLDETLSAGSHTVNFAPAGLPSGTYFYSLEAGGEVRTRSLFMLK